MQQLEQPATPGLQHGIGSGEEGGRLSLRRDSDCVRETGRRRSIRRERKRVAVIGADSSRKTRGVFRKNGRNTLGTPGCYLNPRRPELKPVALQRGRRWYYHNIIVLSPLCCQPNSVIEARASSAVNGSVAVSGCPLNFASARSTRSHCARKDGISSWAWQKCALCRTNVIQKSKERIKAVARPIAKNRLIQPGCGSCFGIVVS